MRSEPIPFDIRRASPREYAGLNTFRNLLRLEIIPEDPPIPLAEETQRLQAMPPISEFAAWAVWDKRRERMLAYAHTEIFHTGDNEHLIEFYVEVLPELRRRGLARALLHLTAKEARSKNRRLLITETNDRVPAGAEFLRRIGGRMGMNEPLNQLRVGELDRGLVQSWLEHGRRHESDYALGLWDGAYPDQRMPDISALVQVVYNDEPREQLEIEDTNYTPEVLRQMEMRQLSGGQRRWSMYLADRKDGRLVAITEVFWNPARPAILRQGFTGVLPEHRSRGLGRWLKATMLDKVLRELPEVQVIRTGNAASNAPMLKLNNALGFKKYVSWFAWQVDLESVEKYLAS